MSNNRTTKRLVHFDLMRIIACFFVIFIHVNIFNEKDLLGNDSINNVFLGIFNVLARWSVPCFLMLSGMLFLERNKEISIKKLYGKYILHLVVAYAFWSCVYALYNSFYDAGNSLIDKIKYFLSYCLSGEIHTWYVLVTIGLYMAIPIIKCVINKGSEQLIKYWIIVMFVFSSVVPCIVDMGLPFLSGYVKYINKYMELNFFLGYTLYFVLGYYLCNVQMSKKIKRLIYILSIISLLYSLFALIVLRGIFNYDISVLGYLYVNIVLMSMGVFMFFRDYVSKIKFSEKSKRIITDLSKLTFGIYLIHVLILKIFSRVGYDVSIAPHYISYFLVSISTFIVSGIIICLIKKIPKISKFIC